MTDGDNELKITGDSTDSVSFAADNGWSSVEGTDADAGFNVYTNTDNASVQVKVEQVISDGITN